MANICVVGKLHAVYVLYLYLVLSKPTLKYQHFCFKTESTLQKALNEFLSYDERFYRK